MTMSFEEFSPPHDFFNYTGTFVTKSGLTLSELLSGSSQTPDAGRAVRNTGDLSYDLVQNTKRFNKILESYVRRYPDQWLWIHRRWKTRPEGEPSIY